LKRKLLAFRSPHAAYFPRAAHMKTSDPSDYDHLSRFFEWSLIG
jgi:hypothetical protein